METDSVPFDLSLINDVMVKIPAGEVEMRDDRTKEKWLTAVDSFYLAKFPVTQDLYFAVTGQSLSTFSGERLPVETVSWQEAVIFCNSLSKILESTPCYSLHPDTNSVVFYPTANGFRLPTEAEWQFACQANLKKVRYGELNSIAWYKENANHQTHEVGRKQPNSWGLYDMLGNQCVGVVPRYLQ